MEIKPLRSQMAFCRIRVKRDLINLCYDLCNQKPWRGRNMSNHIKCMVPILDGNHVAYERRKIGLYGLWLLLIIECLEQIKLQRLLRTCAPISELPSNTSAIWSRTKAFEAFHPWEVSKWVNEWVDEWMSEWVSEWVSS